VANKIKSKYTFPKSTEFTPRDLIVDVKNGHLYYKSNYAVYRVNSTLFSSNVDVTADTSIGESLTTEVLFNNSSIIDGLANFTVTALTDGSGNGTVNIGTVNIDGGSIDGTPVGTNATSTGTFTTLGSSGLATLAQATVSDLTAARIVYTGTGGRLKETSNLSFNDSTNTLTVSKIGAFTAAGAINFSDKNMTNVDINSGNIDDTQIGISTQRRANFTRVLLTDQNDEKHLSTNTGDLFLTNSNQDFSSNASGGAIRIIQNSNSYAPFVHVKGGLFVMAHANSPGAIKATQDIIAYASDKRLKENIINIENPLQKIKQLRGVYFDWKDMTKELGFVPPTMKNEIGMIAQEVEAVIPQAIDIAPFDELYEGTDREKYKTIKYNRLIPLLVECINEQQKQIDNLTNQIEQWQK